MFYATLLLTALTAVSPVLAFTNGSLIPSYICDPNPDGLPKSYGQLLPYTREDLCAIAFNDNPNDNLMTVPQFNGSTGAPNGTQVMNTAFILASFHNTLNSLEPIQQGIVITLPNGATSLPAGQQVLLTLTSSVPNMNLDGALLYAQEGTTRVGSFSDAGGVFQPFPGCGLNQQGQFAGVIQEMVISDTPTYSQLSFNVPACVKSGNITMAGLSVTDAGFGVWSYNFPVTGSTCTTTTTTEVVEIEVINVGGSGTWTGRISKD